MPITSGFPDADIPVVDIWSYYMERPREYPDDHTLLVEGETGRTYSFNDMRSMSIAFGQGLKHMFGWSKGDVMGVTSPNNIDIPLMNFGVHWAGGIVSPANPTFTVDELARQLKDSGAKALATNKAFLDGACEAAAKAGIPMNRVIIVGEERDETFKFANWKDISAKGAWITPRKTPVDPKKDMAYLVYSSGTTGLPKGVALTHYNMVANSVQGWRCETKSMGWFSDSQLGVLPWFHIYGLSTVLNVTWISGAKCVSMAKFDLETFCRIIQEHKITFVYVPPPIVLALSKHPVVSKYDLSSLRWLNSGAAPLSMDLALAAWNRLKVGVKQGYGLSETGPIVATQLIEEWYKFQGSVGQLVQNMQAKIIDENGQELGMGQAGELLLKGPNVFGGYWKRPDLEKETFTDDGWLRTGDAALYDANGNIFITDRLKELIKYKGFQVPPAELEAKIVGREDVADVCVIGIWDEEQHTEVPRAYITLKAGLEAGTPELAKEITEWLNSKVSPPKRLRGGVVFVKEVPKSASGKILRRLMKAQLKDGAVVKAKL